MPRGRRRLVEDAGSDPTRQLEVSAFNPLHPRPLGESVSRALLEQPCHPLPPELPFQGAGVYAIYYKGPSPYYRPIAMLNQEACSQPVYVGKADPPGRRKGIYIERPGRALYNRLRDHAESISEVETNTAADSPDHLRLKDFMCRFLVVEPVWIPLIESLSITTFQPVWNGLVSGFGHHDQGSTRRTQKRSFWDTLHPGRQWATQFVPNPLGAETVACVLDVWLDNPALKLPEQPRRASPEMIADIFEAWLQDPVHFRTQRWLRANRSRYDAQQQPELEEEPAAGVVVLEDDGD